MSDIKKEGRSRPKQVIAVTGAKGGVGKTFIAVNLGVSLATLGQKVCLLDADFGLANIDIMLGLQPTYSITDVIHNRIAIDKMLCNGPAGVQVISGGSSKHPYTALQNKELLGFVDYISSSLLNIDTLIVDTAAGMADAVTQLACASQEIVIVISTEPTSLADAYALIKYLVLNRKITRFRVVVNMAQNIFDAKKAFDKLSFVTNKHLQVVLHFWGVIPYDNLVGKSICSRRSVVEAYPGAKATKALKKLACKINELRTPFVDRGYTQFYAENFLINNGF